MCMPSNLFLDAQDKLSRVAGTETPQPDNTKALHDLLDSMLETAGGLTGAKSHRRTREAV